MIADKMLMLGKKSSVIREIFEYGNRRRQEIGAENVFDFSLGNPSIPAPGCVSDTLKRLIDTVPAQKLHAYTSAPGDMGVRERIAAYIRATHGVPAEASLIYMTCGAAASLCCALTALCGEGEEAAVIAPFFPEYRVFIERTGARVQVIPARAGDFQIDECALREGIHPNTALLIINSPNNPTGAVLTEESLCKLARVLREKAAEYGHPIYLVSDEPYRELSYDRPVPYVTKFYRDTLVCYSFSKSLSLPGERIGYVAVNPDMPDAQDVFKAVCGAGRALGYVCAPALMQYMAGELIGQTADVDAYRENRDLLYGALRDMGFTCVYPDGAFYLFMKAAEDDAGAFCEKARQFELLLVPGDDFGGAGYVRISYCVSRDTILRALPAFEKLSSLYWLKKEI